MTGSHRRFIHSVAAARGGRQVSGAHLKVMEFVSKHREDVNILHSRATTAGSRVERDGAVATVAMLGCEPKVVREARPTHRRERRPGGGATCRRRRLGHREIGEGLIGRRRPRRRRPRHLDAAALGDALKRLERAIEWRLGHSVGLLRGGAGSFLHRHIRGGLRRRATTGASSLAAVGRAHQKVRAGMGVRGGASGERAKRVLSGATMLAGDGSWETAERGGEG